ncbi:putative calcium-binding protein [Senna tora]|uniref:Putative calcium-binding protein n=1 Tax=Senna tora TaxID=362788 RepID=A0A834T463_9FABA|nr:putative calcium-binding protein [Senna tora]
MVAAASSNVAKFNRRRVKDPALLVIGDDSNGDLSRTDTGRFSSKAEVVERDPSCVSCTTFNILAPIYKRLDPQDFDGFIQNQRLRESDFRSLWLARNQRILDCLLYESSSIMCLQEFWVGNEELVQMYEERLGNAGYRLLKLARTNNRGDGLLTAIQKEYLRVVNYRELLFKDFGDRVAQLIHVESVDPFSQSQKGSFHQEFLIVNTHLLFPHDSSLSIVRLHQVYQILQNVELYQRENKLRPMPIILCGDWNGSKRGHVYKFLRSQGFISSYDIAHQYTDSDADAHKWVSHRNHRGNICGVDFIWLCNPNKARKPLKTSWAEAVFSIIKYQLREASLSEKDAFAFLKGDNCGDFVTFCSFSEALRQVKLIGAPCGLCFQQLEDLWTEADVDGNGILDFELFKQKIWNSTCSGGNVLEYQNGCVEDGANTESLPEAIGFKVKNAVLFPREVEKGSWPDDYSLSDHACLTVAFSPAAMRCSALQNCS